MSLISDKSSYNLISKAEYYANEAIEKICEKIKDLELLKDHINSKSPETNESDLLKEKDNVLDVVLFTNPDNEMNLRSSRNDFLIKANPYIRLSFVGINKIITSLVKKYQQKFVPRLKNEIARLNKLLIQATDPDLVVDEIERIKLKLNNTRFLPPIPYIILEYIVKNVRLMNPDGNLMEKANMDEVSKPDVQFWIKFFQEMIEELDSSDFSNTVHLVNNIETEVNYKPFWLHYVIPYFLNSHWTKEQGLRLNSIVSKFGPFGKWKEIAQEMGPGFTPARCFSYYQRNVNPSFYLHRTWSVEEDDQLTEIVHQKFKLKTLANVNWQMIAEYHHSRSARECALRAEVLLKNLMPTPLSSIITDIKLNDNAKMLSEKREALVNNDKWTYEEDKNLVSSVNRFGIFASSSYSNSVRGISSWDQIAQNFCGKSSRQCQSRFYALYELLNPWKVEEDILIYEKIISRQLSLSYKDFDRTIWSMAEYLPMRGLSQIRYRIDIIRSWHNLYQFMKFNPVGLMYANNDSEENQQAVQKYWMGTDSFRDFIEKIHQCLDNIQDEYEPVSSGTDESKIRIKSLTIRCRNLQMEFSATARILRHLIIFQQYALFQSIILNQIQIEIENAIVECEPIGEYKKFYGPLLKKTKDEFVLDEFLGTFCSNKGNSDEKYRLSIYVNRAINELNLKRPNTVHPSQTIRVMITYIYKILFLVLREFEENCLVKQNREREHSEEDVEVEDENVFEYPLLSAIVHASKKQTAASSRKRKPNVNFELSTETQVKRTRRYQKELIDTILVQGKRPDNEEEEEDQQQMDTKTVSDDGSSNSDSTENAVHISREFSFLRDPFFSNISQVTMERIKRLRTLISKNNYIFRTTILSINRLNRNYIFNYSRRNLNLFRSIGGENLPTIFYKTIQDLLSNPQLSEKTIISELKKMFTFAKSVDYNLSNIDIIYPYLSADFRGKIEEKILNSISDLFQDFERLKMIPCSYDNSNFTHPIFRDTEGTDASINVMLPSFRTILSFYKLKLRMPEPDEKNSLVKLRLSLNLFFQPASCQLKRDYKQVIKKHSVPSTRSALEKLFTTEKMFFDRSFLRLYTFPALINRFNAKLVMTKAIDLIKSVNNNFVEETLETAVDEDLQIEVDGAEDDFVSDEKLTRLTSQNSILIKIRKLKDEKPIELNVPQSVRRLIQQRFYIEKIEDE